MPIIILILSPILFLFYLAFLFNLLFKKDYLKEVLLEYNNLIESKFRSWSLAIILSFLGVFIVVSSLVIVLSPESFVPDTSLQFKMMTICLSIFSAFGFLLLIKALLVLILSPQKISLFSRFLIKKSIYYLIVFAVFLLYIFFTILTYLSYKLFLFDLLR